jgi:regulatory factor X 1/2/3
MPDVLRAIPGNFSQQIRNFAKSLENWLRNALSNIPEEMQQIKVFYFF